MSVEVIDRRIGSSNGGTQLVLTSVLAAGRLMCEFVVRV
jgi:hypothetical protein